MDSSGGGEDSGQAEADSEHKGVGERTYQQFDYQEFLQLATRVLDLRDEDSLNDLGVMIARWVEQLGTMSTFVGILAVSRSKAASKVACGSLAFVRVYEGARKLPLPRVLEQNCMHDKPISSSSRNRSLGNQS
ncbi:hypothetical protein Salat_0516800 [Sesamum alatum]|uniref:Uncharacterized protein n=1 Tax=Sesamum alatum TaxID=300844 RepID=A0AAE1Z4U2_9LAMI|nr:hypothetical protein Salat_0516800 [Sesamum alatum]